MDEKSQNNTFRNLLLGILILTIIVTTSNIIFYSNKDVIDVNPPFAWAMLIVNIILLIACFAIFVIVIIKMLTPPVKTNIPSLRGREKYIPQNIPENIQTESDINKQNVEPVQLPQPIQNIQTVPQLPIYNLEDEAKDLTRFAVSTY